MKRISFEEEKELKGEYFIFEDKNEIFEWMKE